jgi:N-acetylmuramoyl-L-alanine amidase
MRWSKPLCLLGMLLLAIAPALRSADERRLTVFSPQASYSVAIVERDGRQYVGLQELLEPLAHPEIRFEGDRIRVRAGQVEGELRSGRSRLKVGRAEVDLGAKVLVEDGRPYVPLHTVSLLLTRLLGQSAELHESSRRLLVGGAGVRFTAELRKGEPSALVLNFSAPVNPSVATEPGRLKLVFTRDALVSSSDSFRFDDAAISGANYSESGAAAQIEVRARVPLMANFSDGGRTITISAAPGGGAPAVFGQVQPPPVAPPGPEGSQPEAPLPTGNLPLPMAPGSPRPRYLVVIDPAHGGADPGAKLKDGLEEKEVVLAFARRLRAALAERGVNAHLLRDGDASLGNEQRAAAANSLHATIFVTVHAGTPGTGVRLYTSLLPDAENRPAAFYPWETAQSFFMRPSRIVAQAAVAELSKRKVTVLLMPANLRPMNNVAAASLGVELAAPAADPQRVTNARAQEAIAAAIAAGIANARSVLEAPQ